MEIPDNTVLPFGLACELLDLPEHIVRSLIAQGKIAAHRSVGGQRRVTAGAVSAYLKSRPPMEES